MRRLGLVLLVLCSSSACLGPAAGSWTQTISQEDRSRVLSALPVEAGESILALSEIFYERITSRRFNSRATFEDPSMRQFFPTVAAYSDYYAALVDALDEANIEFNRPTRIDLLAIDVARDGSLALSLRFVGHNDLPLRWWNARLLRTDQWRWQEGRWWLVPGKI